MQPAIQPVKGQPVAPPLIGGEIPLIDVSAYLAGVPGAAETAAAELRYAFENVGFYYLAGHGVPQKLIDATYDAAARFHAQPMDAKLTVKVDEHNIGYMPIAQKAPPNAAAQGKKPSQNEAYFLRRERDANDPDVISGRRFHAPNKWPADLPGFRETALEYIATLEKALPEAGEALRAGARSPGNLFRRVLRQAAHDPAHVALSRRSMAPTRASRAWCRTPTPAS